MKLFRSCLFLMIFSIPMACGSITPVRYAKRLHYHHSEKKAPTKKGIALGPIVDSRLSAGETKLDAKQIKVGMEDIRRILGHYFIFSRRYDKVVQVMPEFSGAKFSDFINTARQSDCDYLLVGEVTQFDIKIYGMNWRYIPSIIGDLTILPLNLFVYVLTAGETLIFSGGLVAVAVVAVRLSVIFNLYDVRTGKIVKTFIRSERVRNPATSYQMMGYFYDERDDWLDFGRKLGRYTVQNTSILLTDQIADFIIDINK